MITSWENRLLHCCGGGGGGGNAASGSGGILLDFDIEEEPLVIERIVPDYALNALLPISVVVPLRIVSYLRLPGRKYEIQDTSEEVPVVIVDWMKSDPRYAGYFA